MTLMCGRFSQTKPEQEVIERFKLAGTFMQAALQANYNIAPSQEVAAIIQQEQERLLVPMNWGLVPPWNQELKLINARAETLSQKPSFKQPFLHRRCLIPADGFYEWKKTESGKIPHFIHLKDHSLFAFAGLWNQSETGHTCTIITTDANALIQPIHSRMPLILPKELESDWLDPQITDPVQLEPLLLSYPSSQMVLYPVSNYVNSWKNQGEQCILPSDL